LLFGERIFLIDVLLLVDDFGCSDLDLTMILFFELVGGDVLRLFRLACFWQSIVVSCGVSELGLFHKQVDIIVNLHLTSHSRLVLKLNLDFALHLTVDNDARSRRPLFYLGSLRLSLNSLLFWVDRWIKVLACRIYLAVPFLLGHDRFAI